MKTLTSAAAASAIQALGSEPIIIVKIEWVGGTEYYSEKTFTLDAISAQGKIVSFNPIQGVQKTDTVGEVTGSSVVLDDTDGTLKTKINTEIIEGKVVTVYQHFEGDAEADLTVLLKGKIAGGIGWSEGDRTLDISIDTSVEDKEVGFAPDEIDIPDIDPLAVDKPWPLCFGTVIHVPAIRVLHNPEGQLGTGVNQHSTAFIVKGGELFPQTPTVITIDVGEIRYTGTMDGEEFTVVSSNVSRGSFAFLNRPIGDPHETDPRVGWITGNVDITGLYCYVTSSAGFSINQCIRQEGNKCFFREPWGVHLASNPRIVTYFAPGLGDTILNATGVPSTVWNNARAIFERSNFPVTVLYTGEILFRNEFGQSEIKKDQWQLYSGIEVELVTDYDNTWVCNLLPSTEILAVYGHRTVDGEKVFVPIPSSYYTTNLSDSLGGESPTTVVFPIPLKDRAGENWKGDVFVSLRSSIGTNVSNIIEWLVNTYTNLTVDSTFSTVAGKVGLYPANFAVFDQPNVLALIEDIAWQSRCAVLIQNGIMSMKYLSEIHSAIDTIDESITEFKSLELGFTDTDDIITRLTANWKKDYSGREKSDRKVVYKNNIDIFNLAEEEREFTIYNNADLVKLSAFWWGYRYSNSWRKVSFKTFMDTLALNIFDTVSHEIDVISTNALRGLIEDISQDTGEQSFTFETELASKAGDSDSGQPIEDLDYFLGDPAFPVDPWNNPITVPDPGEGFEETDYTVPPETDSGDPSTAPPPAQFDLFFVDYPDLVERAVAFSVRIELRDSNNQLVNQDLVATLELSTAGIDTLTPLSVSLVGGVFEGNLTIDDDSSNQTGFLTATAGGVNPGQTVEFDIVDARASLTFVGPIPNVTREALQLQLKVLSGGVVGEVVDVILNSAQADKLYDSGGTEITQLTADALGDFFLPTDWNIKGGTSVVPSAQFIFKDTTQLKYDDVIDCNLFEISGGTTVTVAQSISFSQDNVANGQALEFELPYAVFDAYPFPLTVAVLDSEGNVDTSYADQVTIQILDEFGDPEVGQEWINGGPNAQVQGNILLVTPTNGVWAFDECVLSIPAGVSLVGLEALGSPDTRLRVADTVDVIPPAFSITIQTDPIERGVDYTMTVTALNPDGSVQTSYQPILDPTITLSGGDVSDAISPTTMGLNGWVDGVKTITFDIDGGSGTDETTLEVAELNRIGSELLTVVADTGYFQRIHSRNQQSRITGSASVPPTAGDVCGAEQQQAGIDFWNVQSGARAAIRAAGPPVNAAADAYSILSINSSVTPNYSMSNTHFIGRDRYTINNTHRDDAKGAQARLFLRGAWRTGTGGTVFTDRFNGAKLRLAVDYTGSRFTTGAGFWDATTDIQEWTAAELNQILDDNSVDPGDALDFFIAVPVSWISNIPGTTMYIWFGWIVPFNIARDTSQCGGFSWNYQLRSGLTNMATIED